MREIDEFLQQVLAEKKKLEADPTPQTPAYALLAAGKFEEAEAVSRLAVLELEKGNVGLGKNTAVAHPEKVILQSESAALHKQDAAAENHTRLTLLADALIAQGIALARLKKLLATQATLERAIAVAQEAGAPDQAALAALTMMEELEQLSGQTLLSLYEQATAGMAKMRNRKLQWRLIDVARNIMTRFGGKIDPDRALDILLAPPSLHEELMRFEERLIEHVLAQTNGGLSDSASSFPLIQERLTCLIELRPKPSLKKRTTVRRRSRQIDSDRVGRRHIQ
ncbi:MAG: hypothetical protein AABN95_08225 [Acidobacteriota bacterium]